MSLACYAEVQEGLIRFLHSTGEGCDIYFIIVCRIVVFCVCCVLSILACLYMTLCIVCCIITIYDKKKKRDGVKSDRFVCVSD